jgi:hypothetical protein
MFYPGNILHWIMETQSPSQPPPKRYTAFAGPCRIAGGDLARVALKAREALQSGESVLIFDDLTSEQVEVDFRGSPQEILTRLRRPVEAEDVLAECRKGGTQGPGRPKLGVVGREVTLLPRHWEWLETQPGGASVTLRKLVEAAKRANAGLDRARTAQEATYRFMRVMAGNLPGFEEATRVLFAKRKGRLKQFEAQVRGWPRDVRRHVLQLMKRTLRMEGASSAPGDSKSRLRST